MINRAGDIYKDEKSISGDLNQSLGSFENGEDPVLRDQQGNEYINMCLSERKHLIDEHETSSALIKKSEQFVASLKAITEMYPVKVHSKGSCFDLFFHKKNPESFSEMKIYDSDNAQWFFRHLKKEGVLFSEGQDGVNHVSDKHTEQQLRLIIIAVQRALSFVYGYVDNM